MKKLFLPLLCLCSLTACSSNENEWENGPYETLSVRFVEPSVWDGKTFPATQICHKEGGNSSTPALYVNNIPAGTNVITMEINNLSNVALAEDGGLGTIGFYHDGSAAATLFPVPGETYTLPSFAFEEKVNRINPSKPYPYLPPCAKLNNKYSLTIKALKRTGSFDKQQSTVLGQGRIALGTY